MADDDVDHELLELLRQRLGMGPSSGPPDTGVLRDAEFIADNSVDVAIDMLGTQAVAERVYRALENRPLPDKLAWCANGLHPSSGDDKALEFVFTMDLLNFSFWPEKEGDGFAVEYAGKKWSGYWSLIAAMRRAIDEGVDITNPNFWHSEEFTIETLQNVFRSDSEKQIPLLEERFKVLKKSAEVLCKEFEMSIPQVIEKGKNSAAGLVKLLAEKFPAFRDEAKFEGKRVRFYKRAQILVADIWSAFEGDGYGKFDDIDHLTMFPDYRVAQQLRDFGALIYSPPLDSHISGQNEITPGHHWECQIRGCSIWCVELIRRQILKAHPEAQVNAVTIDFYLYDLAKELEASGASITKHHRTRSIWY